jgi:hypothetical protein
MPKLNFKLEADDSELKKTLANVAKYSAETNNQVAKEISKNVDGEVKARQKAVKAAQDQKSVSLEVVNSINEETKAHDRATESIKRKNAAFDEITGKQIKPVQMTSSLDEVNASNASKLGSLTGGTVVGSAAEFNKAASEATAFGAAATDANQKATDSTNKTTQAIKNAITAEDTWKLRIQSYQNIKSSSTDPAIIAEYTKKIQEAQAEIAKLGNVGKRGYDELGNRIKGTIGQQEILTTRLKYFQDQLNYAKAPQSFVALNKKIQETQEALDRLSNVGKKGFDDLGNKIKDSDGSANTFLGTLKKIAAAILSAFSIQIIISWAKEARELAARGEGIREAFAKLDDGKTLELLRNATRGATSDIDLMAQALRANNFKIAPDLLAKGLELAGKVSRQTGQDVTYLADSFVNGLGRKSLLILDNLQISQMQLRAEIKKTGNFQTAVANVVNEKLESMGEVLMTTADKMAQFATKIANIKELVGQKINLVLNYDGLREANKEFYATGLSVKNLQDNISPLLTKYDELTAKAAKNGGVTKLTKMEQALLNDIIKQVGTEIPGAITQFNQYGEAMSISTERAKDFIKQQILVLQALNADRITESTKTLNKYGRELASLDSQAEELAKKGYFSVTEIASAGSGGRGTQIIRKSTEEEKKALVARRAVLINEVAKTNALLNADSGTLLSARQKLNDEFKNKPPKGGGEADDVINKARERQARADEAALAAQESLQQRMQVLKDKFARAGLTKEQEARQAIIDEFKKLAFDIEQQGRKYDSYVRKYGAARAAEVLGPKQTTAEIEPIRKAALDDLVYRQDTAKFELSLEKQKNAYAAFEEWKQQFGEQSAKKRFGAELDTSTTYLKKVQDNYSKLIFKSVASSLGGENLTGSEQDRLTSATKLLADASNAIQLKQNADYASAYQAAQSHAQKIDKINADFRKKAADLRDSITDANKIELNRQKEDAINAANDEALAKTTIYKKLAEETILLTREQVKEQIKALNNLLSTGSLPTDVTDKIKQQVSNLQVSLKIGVDQANLNELKKKASLLKKELIDPRTEAGESIILSIKEKERIIKDLREIEAKIIQIDKNGDGILSWGEKAANSLEYLTGSATEVSAGLSKDLGQLSSGFNELSGALGGNDTQAGYLLDTIGQLAKAGSDAAGAFASFASGDIIGGVTKTISAVSSILSIGKKVKEMNAAARKEVEDFYAAAIKGETEYQALLRKRDIDTAARGKNSYRAIIDQLEVIKKQSPEVQAAYDKIFNALQGGSSKEGVGYEHGTWFRKAKTWDIMAALAGSDYDALAKKDAAGKLVGTEKTNFDALKALHDELDAAGISAEDLKKQLGELLTGTSTSQLADGLADLFENGKRNAQDFGDSFEEIMRNSFANSFKAKYLEDALQPFYDELTAMMEAGTPTEDEIQKLKDKYLEIGANADAYLKNIEAITGKSLSKPAIGASGAIVGEAIKEDTANMLIGLARAEYDLSKTRTLYAKDLLANGTAQLNQLIIIAGHTSATAANTSVLNGMAQDMKQIVANTRPSVSTLYQDLLNAGNRG